MQCASLKHLPLIVPFGPVPGIVQTFLLHPLDYCCGTLIFISNYDYKVCGRVGVPLDDNTGDIYVPTMYGLGAALPVVVASRKAIMAFNWDFFCMCGGANALTTKPVVFECMLASFVQVDVSLTKSSSFLGL